MDFIARLLMSSCRHDSIMATIDRLTKVAHFSLIRSSYTTMIVARIFVKGVVRLHLIPR